MQEKLAPGICPKCKSYWPSAAAMLRHKRWHRRKRWVQAVHQSDNEEESDIDDEDVPNESVEEEDGSVEAEDDLAEEEDENMPIFNNIFEMLQSPFVEEE